MPAEKSTKTLIMNAALGAGSELLIDVAPGVDWTAAVAVVLGIQQVCATRTTPSCILLHISAVGLSDSAPPERSCLPAERPHPTGAASWRCVLVRDASVVSTL